MIGGKIYLLIKPIAPFISLSSRYARNSSGQSGAVPASYVEIIPADSNNIDTNLTEIPSSENALQQQIPTSTTEQPTERDGTLDSSFDSLSSSTAQRNSFDPYITILDPSTADTPNPLLGQLIHSSTNTHASTGNESTLEQSSNDIYGETTNKTKSKLFTIKRQKTKSDSEKRRGSTDNGLDVCPFVHWYHSIFFLFHLVSIKRR